MPQFKNYDRARNMCSTSSTGTLTLGDNITGAQSIKAKMSSGDTAKFYFSKGSQWISFLGTFTSPDQLARTRIIDGSSGVATNVDFAVGAGEVGLDVSAEDLDALNLIETTLTCAATCDIGAVYAKYIVLSGTIGPVTSLGTVANKERWVRHSGETITHNGTSLILLGGFDYVTSANDRSLFKSDAAGNWREFARFYSGSSYTSASASGVSMVDATAKTVTSISLPPGEYDLGGVIYYSYGATTTISAITGGFGTVTNTFTGSVGSYVELGFSGMSKTGSFGDALTMPRWRVAPTTTTTYFLIARANFGVSTLTTSGLLTARRILS